MKNQQVVVDYWKMFKTSGLFLLLACSGYVLIKMVQAVFWLPHYLEKNQRKLEELAATYASKLDDKTIESLEKKPEEQPQAMVDETKDIKKDK